MPKLRISWPHTCNRLVAFLDIMGFSERVSRNSHSSVLATMRSFQRGAIKPMEIDAQLTMQGTSDHVWKLFAESMIRPVLFSDSILLVSSNDSVEAVDHMFFSLKWLLIKSLNEGIPVKGAIAYGKQTADFKRSLYFGRPLIDAYELLKELQLYGVILHHTLEKHLRDVQVLSEHEAARDIVKYQTQLRNGSIRHFIVNWVDNDILKQSPEDMLSRMYHTVSGSPRRYVDNTVQFVQWLSEPINIPQSFRPSSRPPSIPK